MTTKVSVSGERNTIGTNSLPASSRSTLTAWVAYYYHSCQRRKMVGLLGVNKQINMEGAFIFWSSSRLILNDRRTFNKVVGGLSPWLRACIRDIRMNMQYEERSTTWLSHEKWKEVLKMCRILTQCTSLRVLQVHEPEMNGWATRNMACLAAAPPHLESLIITACGQSVVYEAWESDGFEQATYRRLLSFLAGYQHLGDDRFLDSADRFPIPVNTKTAPRPRYGFWLFYEKEPQVLTLMDGKQVAVTLSAASNPIPIFRFF